ncbi:MAG: hypothetical protein EOP39_14700 [Rubrivivax sp.]|nr:MAG: hypothetical protein EOP39_14700 [Rubrivivax sp.]
MTPTASLVLFAGLLSAPACSAADRFTRIVEEGGEPTVTAGGYLVNQKRVAVQKELAQRPPTFEELGVKLPPKAVLKLEQTARQIAQYHPVWRVYDYRVQMPRAEFLKHFEDQVLAFDVSANQLKFPTHGGDFVDGLNGEVIQSFRIWRRP